jgi:hypothetical protein
MDLPFQELIDDVKFVNCQKVADTMKNVNATINASPINIRAVPEKLYPDKFIRTCVVMPTQINGINTKIIPQYRTK